MIKVTSLKKLAVLLAVLSLSMAAKAGTIEFSSYSSYIYNADGSTQASVGDLVEIGTLKSGSAFSLNDSATQLLAKLDLIPGGTCAVGDGGYGAGQFDCTITCTLDANIQIYMAIFNAATPDAASAYAVLTNTKAGLAWLTPGASTFAQSNIDVSDPGVYVPVGACGVSLSGSGSGGDVKMAAPAPEPSSVALLGSGLMMLGSMIRRRK